MRRIALVGVAICAGALIALVLWQFGLPRHGPQPVILTPPGTFSDFSGAEKAAGFKIPRIHASSQWQLQDIEVSTPDVGSGGTQEEIDRIRWVSLRYGRDDSALVAITIFRNSDGGLIPAEGGGPAESVQVGGQAALIQESPSADGRVSFASVRWNRGGLQMSAYTLLQKPVALDGRTVLEGFTRAEFLQLLGSVH